MFSLAHLYYYGAVDDCDFCLLPPVDKILGLDLSIDVKKMFIMAHQALIRFLLSRTLEQSSFSAGCKHRVERKAELEDMEEKNRKKYEKLKIDRKIVSEKLVSRLPVRDDA